MAGGPGSYVFGAEEKKELMDVIEAGALFRYGATGVDKIRHITSHRRNEACLPFKR